MTIEQTTPGTIEPLRSQVSALCAFLWDALLLMRLIQKDNELSEDSEIRIEEFIGFADEALSNVDAQGEHMARVYNQALATALAFEEYVATPRLREPGEVIMAAQKLADLVASKAA